MRWRVYTKRLLERTGVSVRWFWCAQLPHGTLESRLGFLSRAECEADAVKRGCRPYDQLCERVAM